MRQSAEKFATGQERLRSRGCRGLKARRVVNFRGLLDPVSARHLRDDMKFATSWLDPPSGHAKASLDGIGFLAKARGLAAVTW
jgi:hypothetical protein